MSQDSSEAYTWESHVRARLRSSFVAIAYICSALGVSTWLGLQLWPQNIQDFEQCAKKAERTAASADHRASLIDQCDKQFLGRRKMGGGYTYYDFLQNRRFDIAGPNPTPTELKHFDEEYTLYLDAQREDAVAAAIAEKQRLKVLADFQNGPYLTGSIPPPGPPMVITPPHAPIPGAGSPAARSKGPRCEDASLSCNWTKFSAGIKKIFGSYARVDHP